MSDKPFHINPETGAVGRCRAEVEPCRFGEANHFEHASEGRQRYEQLRAEEKFTTLQRSKKTALKTVTVQKDNTTERIITGEENVRNVESVENSDDVNGRIQKQSVKKSKTTTSKTSKGYRATEAAMRRAAVFREAAITHYHEEQKNEPSQKKNIGSSQRETRENLHVELKNMAENGDENLLNIVAVNPHSTPEVLLTAERRATSPLTVRALRKHLNYPVQNLPPKQYAESVDQVNAEQRFSDPYITDEHVSAVMVGERAGVNMNIAASLFIRSENMVSSEMIAKLAMRSPTLMIEAVNSGKYTVADHVGDLDSKRIASIAGADKLSERDVEALRWRVRQLQEAAEMDGRKDRFAAGALTLLEQRGSG